MSALFRTTCVDLHHHLSHASVWVSWTCNTVPRGIKGRHTLGRPKCVVDLETEAGRRTNSELTRSGGGHEPAKKRK